MTHTKGPWTVEVLQELTDTGERRPVSYISSSQGWANSGMAGKRTVAVVGHWRDRPNPEDDAHLIAAAPDLLEALERIKRECFVIHNIEGPEKNVHDILEMANKAIQKAREQ